MPAAVLRLAHLGCLLLQLLHLIIEAFVGRQLAGVAALELLQLLQFAPQVSQ